MNILDKIVEAKKLEIKHQKEHVDVEMLQDIPDYYRACNSLVNKLLTQGESGIIAEFKKRSPSKGDINLHAKVEVVTPAYVKAGASGISVLTEKTFFGGSQANLVKAREINPDIPILRKDFMIDPYQMVEAKAYGADVILLIAACLSKNQANELAQAAKELGLEVLMEIHNKEELEIVNDYVDIVGVNNRNLKTFEVNIETSVELGKLIPEKFVKISESGLAGANEIKYLRSNGFKGFLIGETFMKKNDPGKACRKFIQELQ
jgi:indole-3-glycerol phosphate synthase